MKISLPVFVENSWDFDRYCVESVDQLRRIVTLTLLTLPLYENDIFLFTEIFVSTVLWFSVCDSCTSFIEVISNYFVLFDAIANGILKKYVWVMHC